MTGHYLNKWWQSLLTYICVTQPRWVKCVHIIELHPIIPLYRQTNALKQSREHLQLFVLIEWLVPKIANITYSRPQMCFNPRVPSEHEKTWWRHQMETFSALLALCAGNSPVPVNSPHKGQWRGALMFTLICAGINDWVNNREAGDLRRHLDHYDVSVMRYGNIV